MPTCSFLSFRFGPTDGVSVVAQNWAVVLAELGFDISWVAGSFEPGWKASGDIRVIEGLGIGESKVPDINELCDALEGQDLVVVENLLSIPLNLAASNCVVEALRGRPAIIHHHDPPWQREQFAHIEDLPVDDPAWRHVTINELTRRQMSDRGIDATTIYNGFNIDVKQGDRDATRDRLCVADEMLLVAHPVRAIERKDIHQAIQVTESLGGTYWISGPAEDGYGSKLAKELSSANCPVIHASIDNRSDIYAAADLVAFPSTWEGFGNPPIEAALYRRPVFVGNYPVADELRGLGFHWFASEDTEAMRERLNDSDGLNILLEHNHKVASRELSLKKMSQRLENLIIEAGWTHVSS